MVSQSAGLGATNVEAALGMPNQNYNAQGGKIDVRGLSPGIYNVLAIARDPLADSRAGPSPLSTGATVVSITNSDVEDLALSVSPAASITGRLRVEGQVPANFNLGSLRVRLLPTGAGSGVVHTLRYQLSQAAGSAEFYNSTPIAPDGTFRLNNLVAGEYRVEVSGELMGFPGANGYIILLSPNVGEIKGVAVDAAGHPVQGAQVVLIPQRNRQRTELFRPVTADSSGRFLIPSVEPGDYILAAWNAIEPYAFFDPDLITQAERLGRPIQVTELSSQTARDNDSMRLGPADRYAQVFRTR